MRRPLQGRLTHTYGTSKFTRTFQHFLSISACLLWWSLSNVCSNCHVMPTLSCSTRGDSDSRHRRDSFAHCSLSMIVPSAATATTCFSLPFGTASRCIADVCFYRNVAAPRILALLVVLAPAVKTREQQEVHTSSPSHTCFTRTQ